MIVQIVHKTRIYTRPIVAHKFEDSLVRFNEICDIKQSLRINNRTVRYQDLPTISINVYLILQIFIKNILFCFFAVKKITFNRLSACNQQINNFILKANRNDFLYNLFRPYFAIPNSGKTIVDGIKVLDYYC